MDPSAFDALSRRLVTTPTRRGAIAALAGLLSGLLPRADETTAAQPRTCRPLGQVCAPERGLGCCTGVCQDGRCRCRPGQHRCQGRCISKRRCCTNGQCGKGQICRQGRCQCPGEKRRCGKRCIAHDACCQDHECGGGGRCVQGTCRCAAGFKPCAGGCIPQAACCGCTPDQNCVNGACEAKRCGTGAPCRVFVTSTNHNGDLREGGQGSGIDGADAKCQARAQAAGFTGTYKAWLADSDPASAPAQRFTNIDKTGPYVRTDASATVIAANWADLTDGQLLARINATETGGTKEVIGLWTYVLPDGTSGGNNHCLEWTNATAGGNGGATGANIYSDSRWTSNPGSWDCSIGFPLYCFEQG